MKLLGIESAATAASAALLQDDVIIAEYTVNLKLTHSQTLLPMIEELIRVTGTDKRELDAIAVSAGPGSYTGLRIGSATAKGLGLALKKPVVGVSTLAAMAYQFWGSESLISPMLDARRGQVYTGLYRFAEDGTMETVLEPRCILMAQWIDQLKEVQKAAGKNRVLFSGDAVSMHWQEIAENLPGSLAAPAQMNRQRAGAVAALGAVMYKKGEYESAEEHLPVYLRKAQAEHEREKKEGLK